MIAYFHYCGISSPLQIQKTSISRSVRLRAGVILNSSAETPSGPIAFPFTNERMSSVCQVVYGGLNV